MPSAQTLFPVSDANTARFSNPGTQDEDYTDFKAGHALSYFIFSLLPLPALAHAVVPSREGLIFALSATAGVVFGAVRNIPGRTMRRAIRTEYEMDVAAHAFDSKPQAPTHFLWAGFKNGMKRKNATAFVLVHLYGAAAYILAPVVREATRKLNAVGYSRIQPLSRADYMDYAFGWISRSYITPRNNFVANARIAQVRENARQPRRKWFELLKNPCRTPN